METTAFVFSNLDNNGILVVKYVYDAWGNHKALDSDGNDVTSGIGLLNPFRYRGYYYDTETGLYYLQSRYYDPEVGRFISQDSVDYADPTSINGLNLYAYCGNNPVMNVDPTGHSFLVFLFAAIIGFTVSFATSAVSQAIFNGGNVNWGVAAIDGLFGAITSVLWMVPTIGPVLTGLISVGLTFVNGVITTGMESNWEYTAEDWIVISGTAVLSGVASGLARHQFFKDGGQRILKEAHKLVGTIGKRIITGYYSNNKEIISKSLKSATGHMLKTLVNLNFEKGFYKDWVMTLLQAMFGASLLKGLKNLKW